MVKKMSVDEAVIQAGVDRAIRQIREGHAEDAEWSLIHSGLAAEAIMEGSG